MFNFQTYTIKSDKEQERLGKTNVIAEIRQKIPSSSGHVMRANQLQIMY